MKLTNISILVVDDHPIFRQGMKNILKQLPYVKVIDEAGNGAEALEQLARRKYSCLFIDMEMPVMNGPQTIQNVKELYPKVKMIGLSMSSNENYVFEAYKENIGGYILKNTSAAELERALHLIMDGEHYYSAEVSEVLLRRLIQQNKIQEEKVVELSEREKEILELTCRQYSSAEIADMLDISALTVKKHRQNLLEKTQSKNVVGLAVYAIKHNIFLP